MDINWELVVNICMPILTLFLGIWLQPFFEVKEKIIAHYGHVSSFKLKKSDENEQDKWIYTHSVIVRNTGRKPASNLRLGHNVLPDNFIVQPDIENRINALPGGSKELIFPTLAPKKDIMISYLYFPPLTYNQINSHIESDAGAAKVVNVLLQPIVPKMVIFIAWVLMLIGLISCVYMFISLIGSLIFI